VAASNGEGGTSITRPYDKLGVKGIPCGREGRKAAVVPRRLNTVGRLQRARAFVSDRIARKVIEGWVHLWCRCVNRARFFII